MHGSFDLLSPLLASLGWLDSAVWSVLAQAGSTESLVGFKAAYESIVKSLGSIGPEAVLAVAALGVFLVDLVIPVKASRHLAWLAILGCFAAEQAIHPVEGSESLFSGMLVVDAYAIFFKQFFLLGAVPVVLLAYASKDLDGRRMGEFYGLLLTAVLGAMLMAASTHFLMLFMSLELLSICSYVLVGYIRRDRRGSEAALKYVIYGSVAAGVMAFGLSLYYGLTGSADIRTLANIVYETDHEIWSDWSLSTRAAIAATTGLVMIFMGLAYKMSTLPMHFWAPDVYEGSPTPVTAFLSVLSKGAGVALALRFAGYLPFGAPEGSPAIWAKIPWTELMVIIAVVTMTFGNLAALWQDNLKRLLAYSSIAHAGYMLMGIAVLRGPGATYGEINSSQAVCFYLLAYLAMNFGAFAVILLVENKEGSADIKGFQGLGKRSPFLAASLVVFLFSLIGLPPTAGFAGKFQLFKVVIDGIQDPAVSSETVGWFWFLLIAAGANTAISAYYYLRVAKEMYFVESPGRVTELGGSILGRAVVALMVILTFFFFFGADSILATTSKIAVLP